MNKININFEQLDYRYEEELKAFRTNITFCGVDKKVIVMTSTEPGEGKTQSSMMLAYSLSQLNKKVLLLDMDLRKSVIISRFDMDNAEYGMSHFLSGQCGLTDVICSTNIPRLHVAVAGPAAPNPTELLSNDNLHKMLESLREIYDYIIIDSAPLGLVIDAAIIAQECDGAVIVAEAGRIKYKRLQAVKNKLEESGCSILGVVLNKVETKSDKYYGQLDGYDGYYKAGKKGTYEK